MDIGHTELHTAVYDYVYDYLRACINNHNSHVCTHKNKCTKFTKKRLSPNQATKHVILSLTGQFVKISSAYEKLICDILSDNRTSTCFTLLIFLYSSNIKK